MPKIYLTYKNNEYIVSVPSKEVLMSYEKFCHAYTHLSVLFGIYNHNDEKVTFCQKGKLTKGYQRNLDRLVDELVRKLPVSFA